ncbi:valine--tRNA ligase [Candidatus Peregrinibacteria bacterium CG_4_10_14_0_2_um_filter_43_11]|nr:MAG: valine--tRNA ligase [Candidatus Peregrinibacteria bacterium CG_4_10_14_0_2_um_filter_43_11]
MIDPAYNAKDHEDGIYKQWEDSGVFKANVDSQKPSFTIAMPPPNATGVLHLGHAVMLAIEDILIRHRRMKGYEALWVPGTDHAAIATENVVINNLKKNEGMKDPRSMGREALVKRIAEYVAESQGTIRGQVRKIGASCDWSRERYTMDPALNRCVNEVFKKMYDDGLIYRGHRIVNWDPNLQTNVSDDEVDYKEEKSPFYTFQYGPFQIATSRPETKFGDKYVVMHPDDERYKDYKHGDTFKAEWINGEVKATVIKDKAIDMEFGTGVMTITPWHDMTDFEIAERHKLDKEQIIDLNGKLLDIADEFAGMPIHEARELIVQKLDRKGLLVKTDAEYVHKVAINSRGKGVIEPQIREQWFIDVNAKSVPWKGVQMSLKEIMQHVIRDKAISIIPERFEKTYFHWIDNLKDWCISRQIWWGHRIPVWYKTDANENEMHVGTQAPDGDGWEQDPDTLDTWFSSALWTWSTLVDPALAEDHSLSLQDLLQKSPDFVKFHPTQVMETGYDILFFWIARMILMTTYVTGQVPFETVYLHGLIRTREGKKMSKSDPATCINPLDMIEKYGADALRMSMVIGNSPGNDMRLYEEKIKGYRNFTNKLWNASRFVLGILEEKGVTEEPAIKMDHLSPFDEWILTKLNRTITSVDDHLMNFRISQAGEELYSFMWDDFCDWYLELSKGDNQNPTVLYHVLKNLLILLHPIIPFVTETLWSHLPATDDMLIAHEYPAVVAENKGEQGFEQTELLIRLVTSIRRLRAENKVEPAKKVSATLHAHDQLELITPLKEDVIRLARLSELTLEEKGEKIANAATDVIGTIELFLPLEGLVDMEQEKKRLTKEVANLKQYISGLQKKLDNASFVQNAPPAVIEGEQAKLQEARAKMEKIKEQIDGII